MSMESDLVTLLKTICTEPFRTLHRKVQPYRTSPGRGLAA